MGAGPVPIPDAVAKANGVVINHLGSTMATRHRAGEDDGALRVPDAVEMGDGRGGAGIGRDGNGDHEPRMERHARAVHLQWLFQRAMAEMARRIGARSTLLEVAADRGGTSREVAEAIARVSSGNRHDRAGRDVEHRLEPQPPGDCGAGARRRAGDRRCGLHAEHDAAADGRMGHRRGDHRRPKRPVVDSRRFAAGFLRSRVAADQVAVPCRPRTGASTRRWRRTSGTTRRTTTRRRCRACWRCRGVAAGVRGDAGAPFRAASEVFDRAAGRHRGDVAEALRAEGEPAEFGGRNRSAERCQPVPMYARISRGIITWRLQARSARRSCGSDRWASNAANIISSHHPRARPHDDRLGVRSIFRPASRRWSGRYRRLDLNVMDISTTKAIVTGRTRGLGEAIADALLSRGIGVLAMARRRTLRSPRNIRANSHEVELDLADLTVEYWPRRRCVAAFRRGRSDGFAHQRRG